jgi:membrane-bound lytic murein transglycosylase A
MPSPLAEGFARLKGWGDDDLAAALRAYAQSVDLLGPQWPRPDGTPARAFFETRFQVLPTAQNAMLTGYYEPELPGSLTRDDDYRFALYAAPHDLTSQPPWHDRTAIETRNLLAGSELVWLNSALEAFLAQVQGAVRVRLADGRTHRFGYAGKNGHPYSSIGKELLRRGDLSEADCSVTAIRAWAARNPDALGDLLRINKSFVFFRALDLPENVGPLGTMQRSVTAMRSLAVDPAHIPLGAPVWVTMDGMARLMVAQDTGSAILGPARGDIFFGTGPEAGRAAGAVRAKGTMTVLAPKTGRAVA